MKSKIWNICHFFKFQMSKIAAWLPMISSELPFITKKYSYTYEQDKIWNTTLDKLINHEIRIVLQEHPLLVWPLFIFFLILTFYLYPDDYSHIFMQYLFWLVILSLCLFWSYSLWLSISLVVLYLLVGSLTCGTFSGRQQGILIRSDKK